MAEPLGVFWEMAEPLSTCWHMILNHSYRASYETSCRDGVLALDIQLDVDMGHCRLGVNDHACLKKCEPSRTHVKEFSGKKIKKGEVESRLVDF